MGDTVSVVSPAGNVRAMKIVGTLRDRQRRLRREPDLRAAEARAGAAEPAELANRLVVQIDDPYGARQAATLIERAIGYKSVSWQEASKDLLSV